MVLKRLVNGPPITSLAGWLSIPSGAGGLAAIVDFWSEQDEFYDDTGLTDPAVEGDGIGAFKDKSGNGNHLLQATAADEPIFRTAKHLRIGGNNVCKYEDTTDHMELSGFAEFALLDAFAGAIVLQYDEAGISGDIAQLPIGNMQNSGAFNGWFLQSTLSGGEYRLLFGRIGDSPLKQQTVQYTFLVCPGMPHVIMFDCDGTAGVAGLRLWYDFFEVTPMTAANDTISTSIDYTGAAFQIGGRGGTTRTLQGRKTMALIKDGAVWTEGDLTTVKAALETNSGVPDLSGISWDLFCRDDYHETTSATDPCEEGDAVQFLEDISGNNNDLVQATAADRPSYRTWPVNATFNTHPKSGYTGGDHLENDGLGEYDHSDAWTLALLVQFHNITGEQTLAGNHNGTVGWRVFKRADHRIGVEITGATGTVEVHGSTVLLPDLVLNTLSERHYCITVTYDGGGAVGDISIKVNKVAETQTSVSTDTIGTITYGSGHRFKVAAHGDNTAATNPAEIYIGLTAVAPSELTGTDRTDTEDYYMQYAKIIQSFDEHSWVGQYGDRYNLWSDVETTLCVDDDGVRYATDGTTTDEGNDIDQNAAAKRPTYESSSLVDLINDTAVMVFDGGDYLEEVDSDIFEFTINEEFSAYCVFRVTANMTTTQIIMGKLDNSSPNNGWALYLIQTGGGNVRPYLYIIGDGTADSKFRAVGHRLVKGQTYVMMVSYDGLNNVTGMKVWFQGVGSAGHTLNTAITSISYGSAVFQLSGRTGANLPFYGDMLEAGVADKQIKDHDAPIIAAELLNVADVANILSIGPSFYINESSYHSEDAGPSLTSSCEDGEGIEYAEDLSGFGNHLKQLTAADEPAFDADAQISGNAVAIFATGDHLSSPVAGVFRFTKNQPWTVWFITRWDNIGGNQGIIGNKNGQGGDGWGVLLGTTNNDVLMRIEDDAGNLIESSSAQVIGGLRVYTVIASYDGSGLNSGFSMVINGASETMETATGDTLGAMTYANSQVFEVGTLGGSVAASFEGKGKDFGVFERTLTASEKVTLSKHLADSARHLDVGRVPCDLYIISESGSHIVDTGPTSPAVNTNGVEYMYDWSGSGNHLDQANGAGNEPTYTTVTKINGYATVEFDGGTEYLEEITTGQFQYEHDDPVFFGCILNLTTLTNFDTICGKHDGTNGWRVSLDNTPGQLRFTMTDGTNTMTRDSTTVLSTATNYALFIYYDGSANGSGVRMWINAVEETTTNIQNQTLGPITWTGIPFVVGARSDVVNGLDAFVESLFIGNSLLTNAQIGYCLRHLKNRSGT